MILGFFKFITPETEALNIIDVLDETEITYTVVDEDGIISIDTGDQFECYNYYDSLDSVKITLETDHKVISNNADEVASLTYHAKK